MRQNIITEIAGSHFIERDEVRAEGGDHFGKGLIQNLVRAADDAEATQIDRGNAFLGPGRLAATVLPGRLAGAWTLGIGIFAGASLTLALVRGALALTGIVAASRTALAGTIVPPGTTLTLAGATAVLGKCRFGHQGCRAE